MEDTLALLLLGTPDVTIGGRPIGLRSAKSRALLYYLATTSGPRPRGELAGLLWGERPDANARGSLRLALSELRRETGDWLEITRDHVRFRSDHACYLDHRHLTPTTTVGRTLRLWRGEFLDGVAIDDAPLFTDWLAAERHRARMLLRGLLVRHAGERADQVARLARIVTGLDPFDEEAHRLLISSLARTGNRAAALACYDDLRRRLISELGVNLSPETQALWHELVPPRVRGAARRTALPVPCTDLIGREADVRRLTELMDHEPLVTLLGPGGVGKTRLAIAVAAAVAEQTGTEVVFVPFAGVRADTAVTTLARGLGVDLSPPRPARQLLMEGLARRPVVLVLDNLEHLPAFDDVIAEILRRAPGVRVLATSRRRLDLPDHPSVTVEGLPAPAAERLFNARAAIVRPAFDADREAARVAGICAATRGLPLAIELAAGLLRALTCADLARRLGVDLGLLSTAGLAARPRHATMRAVFETSWQLLDAACREGLAALSVFDGGFTLEAALQVARTTPEVLVRLVDHCLIRLEPSGRYLMHPLIQHFAAAHLAEDPAAARDVRHRHAGHFARLLDDHETALQDASNSAVTRVLGAEADNIRLAWEACEPTGRERFLEHYWTLCLRLRLYEEAVGIVRDHLARAPEGTPAWLRARWLRMIGVGHYQLAREPEAMRLATSALDTLRVPLPGTRTGLAVATVGSALRQVRHRLLPTARTDRDPTGAEAGQAAALIARLAYHKQDYATMVMASLRQMNAVERAGAPALRAEAYANFATIARIAGRHGLAGRYGALADKALATVQPPAACDAINRARLARGLDQLASGAFADARRSFREGRSRTLDPRLAESCAGLLAETALWQGDFAEAADLYAVTAELAANRVGDDSGRYLCLAGQAEASLRADGVASARIRQVLVAARASTDRRHALEKQLGLRNGPLTGVIQQMRLLTASARVDVREGDPAAAGAAVTRIVALTAELPSVQTGMLECWSGLAELLWQLHAAGLPPGDGTLRQVHRQLKSYVARNPGAAARLGWADALLLIAMGADRAAAQAAEHGLIAAQRMAAPYDRTRAEDVLHRLAGRHRHRAECAFQ